MSYKNTPEAWKMDGLELSVDQKLNDVYDIASTAAAASLPAVSSADNGKIMLVNSGKWEKAPIPSQLPTVSGDDNGDILTVVEGAWAKAAPPSELPAVTSSDNGKVLSVDNGEWKAIQEHYVSGDKFGNTDGASWFTGTFSSTTSFRFTMTLPKTRHSGTASVTKATASIYLYNGTNKASDVDFKNTTNYTASITLLSDSLASIQLISPTAFSSVTAGSTGSVYFAQGNFEISFT